MKHIYGVLTLLLIVYHLMLTKSLNTLEVAVILGMATFVISKERFIESKHSVTLLIGLLLLTSVFIEGFSLLLGIALFYSVFYGFNLLGLVGVVAVVLVKQLYLDEVTLFWIISGGCYGYVTAHFFRKEAHALLSLDEERRLRHELELTKNQLLQSQDEIEFLTEVKERNRIAREIHDNVGHNIAGVLFHLQAASKMFASKPESSIKMVDESTKKLSETLEMTRETVYNLASDVTVGIEHIKNLIETFDYCPVDFEYKGDYNHLSPKYLALLNNMIKESLTNGAKHSHATHILISLELNEYYLRYSYKDNGVGGTVNFSGLGLKAMKERVDNVGGTMVVDGTNGFSIVCNIPNS